MDSIFQPAVQLFLVSEQQKAGGEVFTQHNLFAVHSRFDGPQAVIDDRFQSHFSRMNFGAARFDLREIEDVIDQR